jgi:FhuF 2Fe-2S C-terminal domain
LGGFFTAAVHSPQDQPAAPWRSLRSLSEDAGPLDDRVEFVQMTLQAGGQNIPRRVAASVVQLGVLARILAPALAAAALGLEPVALDSGALWWQDDLGGAYPLSVTSGSVINLIGGVVSEFTALFADRYRVPLRTLWGNVASAANAAAGQLVLTRPDLADSAYLVAGAVLRDPRVEGGRLRPGADFRRRSCCLIYQAAGSRVAVCGDCVLG